MKRIYKNALPQDKDIVCEDGKITYIGKTAEKGVDLGGLSVFPGLVDIHAHGCAGYDTMDAGNLAPMSRFLASRGTTSWLATTMTAPAEDIRRVVNIDIPKIPNAAEILGFHLEGPYISPDYNGAQLKKYIKKPDTEEFNTFQNIKLVTIAPETDENFEFIKKCTARVAIGHTAADYETALKAVEAGASCLTHTFNAMPPLHHRAPGPIGAAIDKNIYVQVICDGFHIHKSVIYALFKIFGKERMILISDSMRAAGMPDGEYEFGGQSISVRNKAAYTSDGTIAGSTSTLFDCVKKAIEFGIPAEDAFAMASETPCRYLGIGNKGRLKKGCDADFIAVDENYDLKCVVINGEKINY